MIMKKIYLLFVAASLAACSAESVENEMISLDATVTGKNKIAAEAVANEFVVPELICVGEDAEFLINAEVGSNIQVQQYDTELGDWVQVDQVNKTLTNPHITTLNFATAGEYQLRYKAGSGGFSSAYAITVENCGCEEIFSYVDNGDMTYTFTYTPEEEMIDAKLVFTFAQGTSVSGLESWFNNGKAQTWHLEETLNACQTYSWTVALDANCPGKTGENNVWTDFKVNEVSKKADPEDKFVQACN